MKPIPDLKKLVEVYQTIQHAKKHLQKLDTRLLQEKARLESLEQLVEKELADIERLEKLSVGALFAKFLGTHENQYEIEKQEYLTAALQLKESRKVVELLEFEKKVIQEKALQEKAIQEELNQLVAERDLFIKIEYPAIKGQLIDISKKLDHEYAFNREAREAIIVALKSRDSLKRMIELLTQASQTDNWGIREDLIQMKYMEWNTLIDKASEISFKLKQQLQELEDELEDIYQMRALKRMSSFGEFQTFNDIYYDRLISDWMVKKKINGTINFLNGTLNSVERIIETLKTQQTLSERNTKYLQERQKQVIFEYFEK